jgi:WD40 repeat protein
MTAPNGIPSCAPGEGAPPFDVVPVVMSSYQTRQQLAGAEDEACEIADLLVPLGGVVRPWDVPADHRNILATVNRLEEWADPRHPRNSVLLWIGHGTSNDDTAWLLVRGGGGASKDTRLMPEQIARHVTDEHRRRQPPHWAIVVIEACGAGRFAQLVASELQRTEALSGILIIGAGPDRGESYLGVFRQALSRVLSRYGPNDVVITLGDFAARIKDELENSHRGYVFPGTFAGVTPLQRPAPPIGPVTTPVDVQADLVAALEALPPQERDHYVGKGLGTELGEFGCYFAGRRRERSAVLRWLADHRHGLLALTGPPGSGKSALLGNILLHAHPEIRNVLARAGLVDDEWPEASALPAPSGSLVLAGTSAHDVAERLAAIAGVRLPAPATPADARVPMLLEGLRRRAGEPLTVFADGLDESRDPVRVAAALREAGSIPGVRLIVGTRPLPSGSAAPPGKNLLDELGRGRPHVQILHVGRDPGAIREFVTRRLAEVAGPVPEAARDGAIAFAADRLATGSGPGGGRQLLDARLVVREVQADPALLLPEHRHRLDRLLSCDHRELFSMALTRMAREFPAVEPFLEALALSRGRGLPRADLLWVTAAQCLAGPDARRLDEHDLDEVLRLAGPYIMLDSSDGQSVYRLAHRTFQEHYLGRRNASARQLLVTRGLIGAARSQSVLNPYLRRHLPAHASGAGAEGWAELAASPEILDRLDIRAIMSEVMRQRGGVSRLPAAVLGAFITGHLALSGGPADRTALRQLGEARAVGRWPADRAGPGTPRGSGADGEAMAWHAAQRPAWELCRARVRRQAPHLTLTGHARAVRALAVLSPPGRLPLLASGSDDRTIRLWDPAAVRPFGPGVIPLGGRVLSLAGYPAGGSDSWRLAVATDGGPAEIRDATDRSEAEPLITLHGSEARRLLVLAGPDGRSFLITGDGDGRVWLWDLLTGRRVGQPLTGRYRRASAVTAIAALGGAARQPLLAAAGDDHTVQIWNTATMSWVRRLADGHTAPVRSVAALAGDSRGDLLVTGSDDGQAIRWDPGTGAAIGSPMVHPCPVLALAVLRDSSGAQVLATGGEDGKIRLWDPPTGEPVADPLSGHEGPVRSMAVFTSTRARERLATAGDDGTVRIWEPSLLLREPPTGRVGQPGHRRRADGASPPDGMRVDPRGPSPDGTPAGSSPPSAAADNGLVSPSLTLERPGGTTMTARAERNGDIRVAGTGPDGPAGGWLLTGHTDWVTAMAVVTPAPGTPLLVTGGYDKTVRVWDPVAARELHVVPLGMPVRSMAVAGGDLEVTTDEGVLVLRLLLDGFAAEEKAGSRVI